jgi:DNA-directed RNA polymerase sigma subunit (sigma70/sigma32)
MGLSRERVRQIEREALTRLRDQSGIRGPPLPQPRVASMI